MNIYYDRVPYTYLIGWTKLNVWYYGRSTRKGCDPTDLWVNYFTSSNEVKSFRKKHGEPDILEVRKVFIGPESIKKCSEHEVKVIRRMRAVTKTNWLNKGNAGAEFNTSGKVMAKNTITGRLILVDEAIFTVDPFIVGINQGIRFETKKCLYCNKEVAINNIDSHQKYCNFNPQKQIHPKTGVPLSNKAKINMSVNHADTNGIFNPNAKKWRLTSPEGEITLLQGNLDIELRKRNLSRFNLLKYEGIPVPNAKNRTNLSKRTIGWKLEKLV